MLAVATVVVFPQETFAQDIPDDDGEEIEITVREGSTETGIGRFLSFIPINATLFRSINCIEVVFIDNIGEVVITLTNITTGVVLSSVVDSREDTIVIPFSGSSGLWQICFSLSDGSTYIGSFNIN